jgi:cytochrome c oxidase subunit 1
MPRRYADYPDAYTLWNQVSSVGAYISVAATFVFFYAMLLAFLRKQQAPANPWGEGATTLEWLLPSPPPYHTYDTLPKIR